MPAVDANSSYVFGNTSPEDSKATKTLGAGPDTFNASAQVSDPMPAVDANSSYVFGNTSPEDSKATKTLGAGPDTFNASAQLDEPVIDGSNVQLFTENGVEL
jgi:hypothetical protein